MAQMMGAMDGAASIMPEGVDMQKMMESFPIGRVGMMARRRALSPEQIDQLLAMANAAGSLIGTPPSGCPGPRGPGHPVRRASAREEGQQRLVHLVGVRPQHPVRRPLDLDVGRLGQQLPEPARRSTSIGRMLSAVPCTISVGTSIFGMSRAEVGRPGERRGGDRGVAGVVRRPARSRRPPPARCASRGCRRGCRSPEEAGEEGVAVRAHARRRCRRRTPAAPRRRGCRRS